MALGDRVASRCAVTLGVCHLLDGLVARASVEVRKKIVRCSGEEIVRGVVLTPREPRRATLVERDVKSNNGSAGSCARARCEHSTWESVT